MTEAPGRFVDTHVHFWDRTLPELGGYEWLAPGGGPHPVLGETEAIKAPRYLAEDFLAEARFSALDKTVHVQAAIGIRDPVCETRWLQESAARSGHPHGIVAYVDLTDPAAEQVIDRHSAYPNLRGVRDFRYDDYHTNERWQANLRHLVGRGLVLCDDPLIEQMDACKEVAERTPSSPTASTTPAFRSSRDKRAFRTWAAKMRALASVPSTVVKISGLGMSDHRWTIPSMRPWVVECIEAWGAERAFFGTNWPVDRLYSSYRDVVDAYAEIIGDYTSGEREQLFFGNAERIFRL